MTTAAEESAGSPEVSVAGVPLGRRRRLIIDLALIITAFSLITGFLDMRATVRQQTEAFQSLSVRLDQVELRERGITSAVATKADTDRIERRLDRLQEILMTSPKSR